MAASPRWKVYSQNLYIASCHYIEDAAALVALHGQGTTIRDGHRRIVWTEGEESLPASESYDHVLDMVYKRTRAVRGKEEKDAVPGHV